MKGELTNESCGDGRQKGPEDTGTVESTHRLLKMLRRVFFSV